MRDFYIKSLWPGNKWQIINRINNIPIFDGKTNGDDAPLIFRDYDVCKDYLDKINNETMNEEIHADCMEAAFGSHGQG